MKIRFLLIAATLVMALGLVGITLTLAQDPIPSPDAQTESDREAAAAEIKPAVRLHADIVVGAVQRQRVRARLPHRGRARDII